MARMKKRGLNVRVRPDYFNVEENIGVNAVISFKTTRADDLGKFYYDCAKLKYELSEGMYQEVMSSVTGRNFNVTIMIMLQTVEPYDVAVLFWSPDDLANGKYKYRYALSIVKDCFDKKWFPDMMLKPKKEQEVLLICSSRNGVKNCFIRWLLMILNNGIMQNRYSNDRAPT